MRANPDHDWYLNLGLRKISDLKKQRILALITEQMARVDLGLSCVISAPKSRCSIRVSKILSRFMGRL